jgi:hypothetical protein
MRFKLLGGYGWFPSPTGRNGTTNPRALHPKSVQTLLDSAYWGETSEKSLLARASASRDLRTVLRNNDVDAVVLQLQGDDPASVARYVTSAIGCPAYDQDVAVWLHVKQRLADRTPGRDVNTCASPPDFTPQVFVFAPGSTVSGTIYLAAGTSTFVKMSSVSYYLSGGSLHNELVGRGSTTHGGWIAPWNTRSVPNGRYVLRSVAVDGAGQSRTSSGKAITVKN